MEISGCWKEMMTLRGLLGAMHPNPVTLRTFPYCLSNFSLFSLNDKLPGKTFNTSFTGKWAIIESTSIHDGQKNSNCDSQKVIRLPKVS
jgi:hypothetical protein